MAGIIKAMDQQWKDAVFLRAATSALARIGDKRAIPELSDVGTLSLKVFSLTLGSTVHATEQAKDPRAEWWLQRRHISSVDMAVLWMDAYAAIAKMSPCRAMAMAQSMAGSSSEFQCLGASWLANAAATKENKHVPGALVICQGALAKAKTAEVKQWVARLLEELKKAQAAARR